MEPAQDPVRLRLILGKFPVIKIEPLIEVAVGDQRMTVDFGNNVTMQVILPRLADVRLGDLLTFYTEVLTHAHPQSTSVQ